MRFRLQKFLRARRAARVRRGSRAVIALLAVYQAIFLNVFVPSHTPGKITVAGGDITTAARTDAAAHCCGGGTTVSTDAGGDRDPHGGDDTPAAPARSRCAVCNLVARLAPATFVDLELPEHGLLEVLPLLPPPAARSAAAHPTYLGRGPPATGHAVAVIAARAVV